MKKQKMCTGDDCYMMVAEDDIVRNAKGQALQRSVKCHKCQTPQDRRAIKAWRKKERKKLVTTK